MNRALLSILSFVAVVSAVAQVPAAPTPPSATNYVTTSSRIARFIAGPGDRPLGFLSATAATQKRGATSRSPE